VLRNLLCNAAKYSHAGTPISLRAAGAGRGVRVEVIDRGPGIHPEDLPRIFEKFGRGRRHANGPTPGVGMGLYLCRRIARAHGSDLTVDSGSGAGTTFAFELQRVREVPEGSV
jgi:signal transduction histidine kinase